MLLSRKLKIFYMLTFSGMVLMTVSFVSPGWVNCKLSNLKSLMVYSEQLGYPKEAHLSAGLWYFILCIQRLSWTRLLKRDECHSAAQPFNIEAPFANEVLDPTYNKVKGLPRNLLLEIQIMSSIGVVCAVLGFIGTIVYTRTLTKSRWSGLLACISLSISGGTFATVMKTAIATHVNKHVLWDYTGWDITQFYCPWGLVLGGIGNLIILVSALGHLCILSRNRNNDMCSISTKEATGESYRSIPPQP